MSTTSHPTYLDNIPAAVAGIVTATAGYIVEPGAQPEAKEAKLIEYIDKLTRTIATAMCDANAGKLLSDRYSPPPSKISPPHF